MDIAVKKIELIEWLAKIQDKALLEKVENLKKNSIAEAYEAKMRPMTSEQYESMLNEAENDYKSGRITTQEDLEKEYLVS